MAMVTVIVEVATMETITVSIGEMFYYSIDCIDSLSRLSLLTRARMVRFNRLRTRFGVGVGLARSTKQTRL